DFLVQRQAAPRLLQARLDAEGQQRHAVDPEDALHAGGQLVAEAAPAAPDLAAPPVRLAQLTALDVLDALDLRAFDDHSFELLDGRTQLRQLRQPCTDVRDRRLPAADLFRQRIRGHGVSPI